MEYRVPLFILDQSIKKLGFSVEVANTREEGDRDLCLGASMDDYISKPVHLDQLREVIARWIWEVARS